MSASAAVILPFTGATSPVPAAHLAATGRALHFDRHETVFLAGDEADQTFEVVSGVVMLSMLIEDGRRQIVELAFAGDLVGLSATAAYAVTCETLTPSVLRARWKRQCATDSEFQKLLTSRLEKQVCQMHAQSFALGRKTARERVATLLLRFQGVQPTSHLPAKGHLELPMTRAEMGDYLGLSLETVCRTLTDLQNRGVIKIGSRHGVVEVTDLMRLRTLARIDCDA